MTATPDPGAAETVTRPRRALLIAADPDDAPALAAGFDEMRTVTPSDLGSALAGDGTAWEHVAITGVLPGTGALKAVLTEVRTARSAPGSVWLDLGAPMGEQLVADGAGALSGFDVVDRVELAGVSCLQLRINPDAEAVPDLTPLKEDLLGVPPVAARRAAERDAVEAQAEAGQLRRRVAELEADLAASDGGSPAGKPAGPPPARTVVDGRRRKAGIAAAGVLVVAAVAIVLALLTDTGYDGGLLTAVLLLLLANLLYLWRGQRQLGSVVRRAGASSAKKQQKIADAARRRDAALSRSVDALQKRTAELQRNLKVVTASTVETARTVARLPAASNRASLQDLHQTQAIANLFAMLPVDDAVPLMGGWAASPDVVLLLVQELRNRKPRLVVECGSGVSTLWLGLAIKKYGLDARVVALDHDERFAEQTRASLARHGVDHLAEVRKAPLRAIDLPEHETPWYDPTAIADLEGIGLLFVDGPPEATGPRVRFPAVPLLLDRLAPQATIVLDDLMRASEQEITRAWEATLTDFTLERVPLEKGASVFRRG